MAKVIRKELEAKLAALDNEDWDSASSLSNEDVDAILTAPEVDGINAEKPVVLKKPKSSRGKREAHSTVPTGPPHQPSGVIYVGHVPHGFYERAMNGFFKQFGDVVRLRVIRSKKSARCKGYAFVEFASPEVAGIVADTMNGYYLMEKQLVCRQLNFGQINQRMFDGADRTFKKVDWHGMRRKRFNAPRTLEEDVKHTQNLLSKDKAKKKKLAKLGIDYDFPGYTASADHRKEIQEKKISEASTNGTEKSNDMNSDKRKEGHQPPKKPLNASVTTTSSKKRKAREGVTAAASKTVQDTVIDGHASGVETDCGALTAGANSVQGGKDVSSPGDGPGAKSRGNKARKRRKQSSEKSMATREEVRGSGRSTLQGSAGLSSQKEDQAAVDAAHNPGQKSRNVISSGSIGSEGKKTPGKGKRNRTSDKGHPSIGNQGATVSKTSHVATGEDSGAAAGVAEKKETSQAVVGHDAVSKKGSLKKTPVKSKKTPASGKKTPPMSNQSPGDTTKVLEDTEAVPVQEAGGANVAAKTPAKSRKAQHGQDRTSSEGTAKDDNTSGNDATLSKESRTPAKAKESTMDLTRASRSGKKSAKKAKAVTTATPPASVEDKKALPGGQTTPTVTNSSPGVGGAQRDANNKEASESARPHLASKSPSKTTPPKSSKTPLTKTKSEASKITQRTSPQMPVDTSTTTSSKKPSKTPSKPATNKSSKTAAPAPSTTHDSVPSTATPKTTKKRSAAEAVGNDSVEMGARASQSARRKKGRRRS